VVAAVDLSLFDRFYSAVALRTQSDAKPIRHARSESRVMRILFSKRRFPPVIRVAHGAILIPVERRYRETIEHMRAICNSYPPN
jgi:hypothetical protein